MIVSVRYQHDGSSMTDEGWVSVTNKRKIKSRQRQQRKKQWEALKERCPHLISPQHALHLARCLNIDNLAEQLQSTEWIELQMDGWHYTKVLNSLQHSVPEDDDDFTYCVESVGNKYDDRVVFQRPRSAPKTLGSHTVTKEKEDSTL